MRARDCLFHRPKPSPSLLLVAFAAVPLVACGSSSDTGRGPLVASGGAPEGGLVAGNGGTAGAGGNTAAASGGAPTGVGGASSGGDSATGSPDCTSIPTVTITSKASGTPGTWQNVTPPSLDMNPASFSNDNFGVQDVLVDPVRPSDLYTFVCHQGVWKSTDYGATWTKVNTGKNGDVIDGGKPWGSGIDSSQCRDPNTPPALYTLNGNGTVRGFWKSTDGGVSWQVTTLPKQPGLQYEQDAYSIGVDPYSGHHLIMGFHEAVGMLESADGGDTWIVRKPADDGISVYPSFIDTGDPVTTRKTWLTVGQTGATWRTADSGTTWTKVESLTHAHGCSQIFQAGAGVIYEAGLGGSQGDGIYRSVDFGVTWKLESAGSENGVVGTASTLYASYAWANAGGVEPDLKTAPRSDGTTWTSVPTPSGMTNGFKGAAVTFDGDHHVIVGGNWNAGIWRYVEP